ncbi:M48 family metalloprotease [Hyphomicrobium sp.]|uniref:M48 family metalloprotease n=1 Tax=Hyphomicrobium sp. TaxID=82 RepID=UPI000FB2ECBF|nr:M48 family metalloprotease [Hyphomicrobium sp.]RUO98597.1 MAG: hypothetical protein EKK30_10245 [Hyphomicrobium sp.]
MEATTIKPPPEWDRQEIARPYLQALHQHYYRDAIEEGWLDGLFTGLSQELRSVYMGADADRALEGLDRLIEKFDVAERQKRSVEPPRPPIGILERWTRISRLALPRMQTAPENSYNNHTTPPPVQTAQRSTDAPKTRARLNGRAMNKSTMGTWMALVALTWFGLVWNGIISMFFGVGALVFATMFISFFSVPAWATIWSWLGIGWAGNSTLRDMNFKAVPPDHPLAVIAASFARDLELPPPRIGTMDVSNAFAMGTHRNNATIAFGLPLLEVLSPDEVAAIIGHELGHVVSGDMRRMVMMRTFQNAMVFYMVFQKAKQGARWALTWAAELMILANSRKREFYADAVGASLAGKQAMISALRKLENAPPLTSAENTHARFMARGRISSIAQMFSTHPPFDARIRALEQETYIRRLPRAR